MTKWVIDLRGRTATNPSGVVVKFIRSTETEWSGRMIAGKEAIKATEAATIMREAGDEFRRAMIQKDRETPKKTGG